MSVRRRLAVLAVAAVPVLAATSGCGAANRAGDAPDRTVVTLRVLNPLDDTEIAPFLHQVDRLSHGTISLKLHNTWHVGQLDNEVQAVRAVRAGRADLALVPVRAWHALGVRSFDALVAPLTVDSYALERQVLASDLVGPMLAGVAPLGLTPLGVLPGPMRKPVGVSRELLSSNDFRSADIGISSSAVATRFFSTLGGAASPSSFFGQSIAGLDGIESQVQAVEGNHYDGVARSMTANVNLWPRPISVVANSKAFEKLSGPQQDALRHAARKALDGTIRNQLRNEAEATGILCRRGQLRLVRATGDDIASLRGASRPILAWLSQDPVTKDALSRIEAMRPKVAVAADAEPVPSCDGIAPQAAPSAATAGAHGPLDGTWTMTTSAHELAATGGDAEEAAAPENFGDWVFLVDRGRFAFTQRNGEACTWGYGTWDVRGQQVEWRFIDGGGIAPTGAANKPGELFDYAWSLYRDTLTLAPVQNAVSPGNFLAQPWHRVSASVDTSRLFPRCGLPAAGVPR